MIEIHHGNCSTVLSSFGDRKFDLIYIDPPFNTGKTQTKLTTKTTQSVSGDRTGYAGKKYRTQILGQMSFSDSFSNFAQFIFPLLQKAHYLLSANGSFFLHLDYREVHYCKVMLDSIFGKNCFQNEIIWSFDYGARTRKKWPTKHSTILWYSRNAVNFTFNFDAIDRIPYLAPSLVGAEKAARGKTPTDVWWNTIVSPNGKEKTGYPTQKPLNILNRIVTVHSNYGDTVLDFFAGSGTTGEAAEKNGRNSVLIDSSKEAIDVMAKRLSFANPRMYE